MWLGNNHASNATVSCALCGMFMVGTAGARVYHRPNIARCLTPACWLHLHTSQNSFALYGPYRHALYGGFYPKALGKQVILGCNSEPTITMDYQGRVLLWLIAMSTCCNQTYVEQSLLHPITFYYRSNILLSTAWHSIIVHQLMWIMYLVGCR